MSEPISNINEPKEKSIMQWTQKKTRKDTWHCNEYLTITANQDIKFNLGFGYAHIQLKTVKANGQVITIKNKKPSTPTEQQVILDVLFSGEPITLEFCNAYRVALAVTLPPFTPDLIIQRNQSIIEVFQRKQAQNRPDKRSELMKLF